MNITISEEIKKKTPQFSVGVLECDVTISHNASLDAIIHELETNFSKQYDINDVVGMNVIKEGRDAYKTYGKDPSRYRLAVESLIRRIVKGNQLYRINNVVDIGNIVSIETKKSIAVLDKDKIQGDIFIRLGRETDVYEGIGRGILNIENIPLYEDDLGPFGSTTSDTMRTMISENTTHILVFIISFTGSMSLQKELQRTMELYRDYAQGTNFTFNII